MSRGIRVFSELGVYHIMFRGINKQDIFREEFDFKVMLNYLVDVKKKIPFDIYAYCLMTNHVHLIIKEKELRDISLIMKSLLVKYALYFNNKYGRCGHVFESRYKSKPITSDDYLLASLRYIHQNPVKAEISANIEDYPWSSYNEYIKSIDGLIDKNFILNIININQFKRMHKGTTDDCDPFDSQSQKLIELKKEIINNYHINPTDISNLPCRDKRKIFMELRQKYSLGNISTITGVSKSSISTYK